MSLIIFVLNRFPNRHPKTNNDNLYPCMDTVTESQVRYCNRKPG